ncbi:MAG: polysaccharide deacetylase [Cellulosilyticum sp.]|nr:polysaccharide deacetylase [Cellulosilyticum sp.]
MNTILLKKKMINPPQHFFKRKICSFLFSLFILCTIPFHLIGSELSSLDNTKTDWWLVRAKNHQTPGFNDKLSYKLEDYGGCCLGDTTRQVVYLTFDEGYENGYTARILDVLKSQDVKAMFFVTLPYIEKNPDLIKRMFEEGHYVCNHTDHHLSMPSVANDETKFNSEITSVANAYEQITNSKMPPFFRPPMGHYSQRSLAMTKALGYQTVFWSFAYCDWKPDAQPNPTNAEKLMLDGLHNGAIYLLHAVSKTNTEVLGDFITKAREMGYTFELLPNP